MNNNHQQTPREIIDRLAESVNGSGNEAVSEALRKFSKEIENTEERNDIAAAEAAIQRAKSDINSALATVTDPNIRKELTQALQSLAPNVSNKPEALAAIPFAEQLSRLAGGAEGAKIIETAGSMFAGLAGFGEAIGGLKVVSAAVVSLPEGMLNTENMKSNIRHLASLFGENKGLDGPGH